MSITIERCPVCGNAERGAESLVNKLKSSEALTERLFESLSHSDDIWVMACSAAGIKQEQMLNVVRFAMFPSSGGFTEDGFENMVKFCTERAIRYIEKNLSEPGRIVETGERRLFEWYKQEIEKSKKEKTCKT